MISGKRVKALEMLIKNEIKTYKELSIKLKISERTLYRWLQDEEFKRELNAKRNTQILYLAPRALKKINELINSSNANISFKACKDILDRAGYKNIEIISVSGNVQNNNFVAVAFGGVLEE